MMRIFALVIALLAVSFADAAAPVVRVQVGRSRVQVRRNVARIRVTPNRVRVRRAAIIVQPRAAIVVQPHVAQIVVRRQAFYAHQIQPIVAVQHVVVPTYQAFVAPSAITVQRIVTAPYTAPIAQEEAPVDPCPIQPIVTQRVITGCSGYSGATAAFRAY